MPQTQTVVLPQGTYADGVYNLGPATVPSTVSGFQLTLDGTNMTDPTLQITIDVDLSLDSGVTWASANPGPATIPFPVQATIQGGVLDKTGHPLAAYGLGVSPIPGVGSTTRQIKATVTVSGVPLTTSGTLTLTT